MGQDDFERLRDTLAQITAPTLSVEEIGNLLDEALGQAKRAEQLARAPANHLDGAMSQALAVHLAAADAAAAFTEVARRIAEKAAECKAASTHAREALASTMDRTGAPDTETATHKATPIEASDKVEIYDVAELPQDCIEFVAKPINKKISARLIAGMPTPGAKLVAGSPGIRVTAKAVKRGMAA